MPQPLNIRLFEIALGLSLGILFGHYSGVMLPHGDVIYFYLALLFTLSYLLIFHVNRWLWWLNRLWFFTLWIGLGALHYTHQFPKAFQNNPDLALYRPDNASSGLNALELKHELKPWGNSRRYLAKLHCPGINSPLRVLIHTRDSLLIPHLDPDKTLWTNAIPMEIKSGPNPGGFNQKTYYHSQGIQHSVALKLDQVYCWDLHPLSLRAKAKSINTYLANYWRKAPISHEAKALALAMILGQTEDLTAEIKSEFATAGALHILALSGLHVGLLVLLLQWALRGFKSLPYGDKIYPVLVLVALWSYALICGLSPSITRAVCMFSLWQLGQIIRRPMSGSNSVLLTYVLLLWWAPYWLFSVGFQLSFTAVLALTYIPAQCQKIGYPKNKIYRYFTELSVVGITAQIGVGPLSVFYFSQFPLLFWLSNLLVLPMVTPLLTLGLVISIGCLILPIPELIWQVWDQLLQLILWVIEWIAEYDHLLLKDLNLSWGLVAAYYLIALFLWWGLQHPWISHRRILNLLLPYLLSGVLLGQIIHSTFKKEKIPEFTLLHRYKSTVIIAHTPKGYMALLNGQNPNKRVLSEWSKHHMVELIGTKSLPPILSFDGVPVVVIDGQGVYPGLRNGVIILTNNANIHMESLINDLAPCTILADGSNAKYLVDLWRNRAKQFNQHFLDTYAKGAIETNEPQFKTYF